MKLLLTIVSLSVSQLVLAQIDPLPVTRPAGSQYAASGWKTLWWGKHYRKEWTTPVQFGILNFSAVDGGLEPEKMGGGHQTKTLRLVSGNGREYVLRTIDKNLDVLVPAELKGSFINHILNDQISTAHPYGPIVIARLAEAISILHTNPVIYYVPDDPVLGEFRSIFANKLCLLEERPSGKGWDHTPQFGNANDIVNTEKLVERTRSNTKNFVDQQTYLKVRLFDMIINDWDRHEDQWIWAKKDMGKQNMYIPIARDRDQAFSKTDGLNLLFLSQPWALRPLKNFSPSIHDVRGENFSARNLDQQFLNRLTKGEWQQVITALQAKLTDAAIDVSLGVMPTEVAQISGDFLSKRLKQRRDNLSRYGMKYYAALAKHITIIGSEEKERFLLKVLNRKQIAVTGLSAANDTFYHRVFNRNETKEINVYGLGGDDEFQYIKNARNRFKVRALGGEGNNTYKSNDRAGGGRRVILFDSLKLKERSKPAYRVVNRWDSLYRYNRVSVKYDWYMPLIIPGYNEDDGFVIGLGLLYKKQKWGKTPFGWQQQFVVTHASGTGAVGFEYKALFKNAVNKWDLGLEAYYKGPRYTFNYYGLGNETELNDHNKSYFRVKGNDLYVAPGISRSTKRNYFRISLQYESVKILPSNDKFIGSQQSEIDSSVFSTIHYGGGKVEWAFSNTDDERYPGKGIRLAAKLSYLQDLNDTKELLQAKASIAFYHTFFKKLTFLHRTGGSTVAGDYKFYQAATLGSDENLRGFWRSRFAGRSSFYQNSELRLSLADLRGYVIRGKFGAFGFFDDGQVWLKNENSSKLHVGYGGGIFLLPYNLTSLNLFYSTSSEASMVTVRANFFF